MSAVATTERAETTPPADNARTWTRTPEQQKMVDDYLTMVEQMYVGADPEYIDALTDPEILGTDGLMDLFGYLRRTRIYQLATESQTYAANGQTPHPSAIPDMDASGGSRGGAEIRGIMKGRAVHWALQSGRFYWDSLNKRVARQTGINHGGAPKRG